MLRHLTIALMALATASMTVDAAEGDWSGWRGPTGTGYAPAAKPPEVFSETQNVRWKTRIPGSGHSSPIVLGDRIYLMTAVEAASGGLNAEAPTTGGAIGQNPPPTPPAADRGNRGGRGEGRGGRGGQGGRGGRGGAPAPQKLHRFMVVAIDRNTGKIAWSTTVREETPHEGIHGTSTHASGSPVTDGKHLYAHFGSRGTYCLDLEGNIIWKTDLGNMETRREFGEGSSPAVHDGTLVVPWDHEGDSFVAALDASTGEEKWRRARDELTNWVTPVISVVNGKAQAILTGRTACIAYDVESGDEVWRSPGLTMNVIPTPIVRDGVAYLMSGFRGAELQAIQLDKAKGNVEGSEALLWTHDRGTPYVPSPMLSGDRLYFLNTNSGILSCLNAKTGEEYYVGQRLGIVRSVYSSIVGANGRVYICGREGNVAVLEDGPEFKVLRTNSLDEGIDATPAIVGDAMYVRGAQHLYCIGTPPVSSINPAD